MLPLTDRLYHLNMTLNHSMDLSNYHNLKIYKRQLFVKLFPLLLCRQRIEFELRGSSFCNVTGNTSISYFGYSTLVRVYYGTVLTLEECSIQ